MTLGGSSDSALSVGWWLGAMMAGCFMFFLLGVLYASTGAAIGSATGQGIGARKCPREVACPERAFIIDVF